MSSDPLPWIIVIVSVTLLVAAGLLWALRRRRPEPAALPTEWSLLPRPVFTGDEKRVYRQLRDALPHHVVLSKLPLVRFCQPTDPERVRYWYELLGSTHVGFAICSAAGRVLAAIDLDTGRPQSRRVQEIKKQVLAACGVRYMNCPIDHLPSIPELQLLVPQSSTSSRGPLSASAAPRPAARTGPGVGATRRRDSRALWQDSGFFQDSFFGTESPGETAAGGPSDFGSFLRGVSVREGPLEEPPGPPGAPPPVRH
ncbi:MAG: DUF2726 domain-containing protein [Rubrivivax sp.]